MDNVETPSVAGLPRPQAKFDRPGYEFVIPGECLEIGSPLWSADDRRNGIWVRLVYLTPSEEIEALQEAQREGALVAASSFTIRKSIVAMASAGDPDEQGARAMGEWKRVGKLDLAAFHKALGFQGRNVCAIGFNLANSTSEENREVATKSFRLVG